MLSVSGARGIVGASMTPPVAAALAAAFAGELRDEFEAGGEVVVARDGRASGADLEEAVCASLAANGWRAVRLGVVATPTTAVMIGHRRAAGGIVITASHNPIEWNGVKFLTSEGAAPPRDCAQRIIDRFRRTPSAVIAKPQAADTVAERDDAGPSVHVKRVLALVDVPSIRKGRFKVVLDSVNGAGGAAGRMLLERLGCTVIHLNGEATGVFAHTPEPTRENLTELAAAVASHHAAVGFAQDPDADRLAIVDEMGRYIGEEYTFVLAAEEVLGGAGDREAKTQAMSGGAKPQAVAGVGGSPLALAVNLSSSRMIDDVAAAHGARIFRTPVGEANVVEAMQRHGCILGGEGNGGVIWPEVCLVRDSLSGMALTLSLLARRGEALGRIVNAMPAYAIEKEKMAIRPGLAERAIEALAAKFPDAAADRQDGLRLDWPDQGAWLHIRASNTEPILRLIAEARDQAKASEIIHAARALLGSLA